MRGPESLGHRLREAAHFGRVQAVKSLIEEGANVNALSEPFGWTALHHAADGSEVNHVFVMQALIQAGANVNLQNTDGDTPLHLAARRGDSVMVEMLLNADSDAQITNNKSQTAEMVVPNGQIALAGLFRTIGGSGPARGRIFGRTIMDPVASSGIGEAKRLAQGLAEGGRELRAAAADGDVAGVQEVLVLYPGIKVDAHDEYGWTALFFAAHGGHPDVVRILLDMGANPSRIEKTQGQSPLHLAAASGSPETVGMILEYHEGIDVDIRDRFGRTPLYFAALGGHVDATRVLLEFDADCALGDQHGHTPLFQAVFHGHEGVVSAILSVKRSGQALENVNRMDFEGNTVLHIAAQKGNLDVARLLVAAGGNLEASNALGAAPLFVATAHGHSRFALMLLEEFGVDPNHANSAWETPLYVATVKGHVTLVKDLLEHGADPEAARLNGFTPLMVAAQEGRIAVMSELVFHNATTHARNNVGETPLLIAARMGYTNAVTFLLHNGANILEAEIQGNTALHLAAEEGHAGVMRILLKALRHRASSESRPSQDHLRANTKGETALHVGAVHGHIAVVEDLLQYDAKMVQGTGGRTPPGAIYGTMINLPNKYGWTALHSAVDAQQHGVVLLLLQYNANVNVRDKFANLPLHLAARHQDNRLVQMLLSVLNANIDAVNGKGKTALHFASCCVRPSTLTALLENGADPLSRDQKGRTALGVLGNQEDCNPNYVFRENLCTNNSAEYRISYLGDMCPVTLGTKSDYTEADDLLQAAMSETQASPNISHDRISTFGQGGPRGSGMRTPLIASLVPIAFLALLVIAIVVAIRRHLGSKNKPTNKNLKADGEKKMTLRQSADSGSYFVKGGEAHIQPIMSSFNIPPLEKHANRQVLSSQSNLFEEALNSLNEAYIDSQGHKEALDTSSEEVETCGWSTEDEGNPAGQSSGQPPQRMDFRVVRIASSSSSSGDLDQHNCRTPLGSQARSRPVCSGDF